MQKKTRQDNKIEIIHFLRSLASLSVVWFHFTTANNQLLKEGFLKSSGQYGYLGVATFFVISGFIIPYTLERKKFKLDQHWKSFVKSRFIRLYPAYLVALIVTWFLWYLSSLHPSFSGIKPDFDIINILCHFLYLNGLFGLPWIGEVFWTLGIEFQYSIFIVFLYPLLVTKKQVLQVYPYIIILFFPLIFRDASNLLFSWLSLFGLGMISFQFFTKKISFPRYFLVIFLVSITTSEVLGTKYMIIALLSAVAIVFLNFPKIFIVQFLSKISYSLYLIHLPIGGRIVNLGSRLNEGILTEILILVTAMSASLIAAFLIYRFVEKPTQEWSHSIKYN